MKKDLIITVAIILIVISLGFFVISMKKISPETDDDIVKCIGENSVLYVQLGCSACKTQEDLFGENVDKLTIVDCFKEREKCLGNIEYTPTWIINGEKVVGVKSIEKLKELTNC